MFLTTFDPFWAYHFEMSQAPERKYGLASVFQEPMEALAEIKPFAPFDIRRVSAPELIAYWVGFAHRLRCEGLNIIPVMMNALQDEFTPQLVRASLSAPESDKVFRSWVKPLREQVFRAEAERLAIIRQGVLAVIRKTDPLAGFGEEARKAATAQGEAHWQQEWLAFPERRPLSPSAAFRMPENAGSVQLRGLFYFLAKLCREEGYWPLENYICDLGYETEAERAGSPYQDPYLCYALNQIHFAYRGAVAVKANLRQREKSLLSELSRRMDALTACFIDLSHQDYSPEHLLQCLNSFWPEDIHASFHKLRDSQESGAA